MISFNNKFSFIYLLLFTNNVFSSADREIIIPSSKPLKDPYLDSLYEEAFTEITKKFENSQQTEYFLILKGYLKRDLVQKQKAHLNFFRNTTDEKLFQNEGWKKLVGHQASDISKILASIQDLLEKRKWTGFPVFKAIKDEQEVAIKAKAEAEKLLLIEKEEKETLEWKY